MATDSRADAPPSPTTMSARARDLYPPSYADSPLPLLVAAGADGLAAAQHGDPPRLSGWANGTGYTELLTRYGDLPDDVVADPVGLVERIARDLFGGAVHWRCPELQYNLGAAVNVVSAAVYALALDVNVYLINDGLAGNAVVAERAVGRILAGLSGVDPDRARGLFTFGGTGTMAYAIKVGIRKAAPESARTGVPANLRVVVTEDAHFSHATAADWLGIGSDALVTVPADVTRRSDLGAAERLMREQVERGARIATIIVNGGTTYDHAVDDIVGFARLRDRLVADYHLDYRPHLHVDSVVGWAWLMFRDYDFAADELGLGAAAAAVLAEQYDRVRHVAGADSWGVDFHKGVGGCPVDCSYVQFNDRTDLARLRRGGAEGVGLHQLATEFSDVSPVDHTLETSRAGGKALGALAGLHSLGRAGYRDILGQLMAACVDFRGLVAARPEMTVLNSHALGYQTMVRLLPPGSTTTAKDELLACGPAAAERVQQGNDYLKKFFTWDNETRMNVDGGGVVYSFSSRYVTTASGAAISGLKFYPTSPLITARHMVEAVDLLARRKAEFDLRTACVSGG